MMIYSGMILNLKELQWEAGWIRHGEGAVVKKKKKVARKAGVLTAILMVWSLA